MFLLLHSFFDIRLACSLSPVMFIYLIVPNSCCTSFSPSDKFLCYFLYFLLEILYLIYNI